MLKMKSKTNIYTGVLFLFVTLIATLCLTTACKPLPEQHAVMQKGNGVLEEMIGQTASPVEHANNKTDIPDSWKYEKQYSSGHRLAVDAVLKNSEGTGIPVITVKEKPFEDGQQLKSLVNVFCPNAKVYDAGILTKSQIEENIIMQQEELYKLKIERKKREEDQKNGAITEEIDYQAAEEWLNAEIARLEEEYKNAPDDSDLKESNFQLTFKGDSYQANLKAIEGDRCVWFAFCNWSVDGGMYLGSEFFMDDSEYEYSEIVETFADPLTMSNEAGFIPEKEYIDQCVHNMGIDYMSLDSVCKTTSGYKYFYTRMVKEFSETYTNVYLGTPYNDPDGEVFRELFKPEHLEIETQNGVVKKVYWKNPTEVTQEDNDNVKTIAWEQVQKTFLKQMDYILSPEPMSNINEENATVFTEETEIIIERIELGLTKVFMKDSVNDYKLIPTWSFMGYDKNLVRPGVTPGAEICFVTINAIDGTVVDRGLMY